MIGDYVVLFEASYKAFKRNFSLSTPLKAETVLSGVAHFMGLRLDQEI
jgi:hypothetical protein